MYRFLCFLLLVLELKAWGVPLETYSDYVVAYPNESRKGQWVQLMARGIGTNDMYVMEVDPTTGALPVNSTITFPYDTNYGAVGDDTLRTAAQLGNATGAAAFGTGTRSAQTLRVTVATDDVVPVSQSGVWSTGRTWTLSNGSDSIAAVQSGTWNITNISGTISLPTGASTEAKQDTGNASLSSIDGKLADDYGVSSGALRTAAQIGNASGAAAFGTGTRSAQTLRVTVATDDVVPVSGTVAATQSGTWNINNVSGTVSLPTGAATEATLSTASSTLTTLNGKVANDYGLASGAVRTAAQVGNASGVADFNTGTAGAQTLRVVQASNSPQGAGRSYSDSSYMSYSSTNVTTGAWVQLDASTAAAFNSIFIFSSCGETLELGTGAGGAESRVLLIPPGGIDGPVDLAIAASTRLALRGVSGNCTSGQITLTGLN